MLSQGLSSAATSRQAPTPPAILNLHEPNRNKLFLSRTRKDSNFKRPPIYATLFQIENCCYAAIGRRGFQGVLTQISLGTNGRTNLQNICVGTNIGDLDYYFARPRNTNEIHGLGAFLIMYE